MIKKLLSKSNFDSRKYPNQKWNESEGADFLGWVLSEVQNWFWKKFFNPVIYIYWSNFFGAIHLKKGRLKKWISHCIFKMWFDHRRADALKIMFIVSSFSACIKTIFLKMKYKTFLFFFFNSGFFKIFLLLWGTHGTQVVKGYKKRCSGNF